MLTNFSIMPIIFVLLLLLPFRLTPLQLKGLAFFLWFVGGLMLLWRGVVWLFGTPGISDPAANLALIVALALVIGWAKGQFVLAKTSRRNIARLDAMTEPQRPYMVYGLRSWMIIAVMIGISAVLNLIGLDPMWRGGINAAIGGALIVSSLVYLRSFQPMTPTS